MDNPQDKISKLLSDPENIKTIAQIAAGFMPASGTPQSGTDEKAGAESADAAGNGENSADTVGKAVGETSAALSAESIAASTQSDAEIVPGGLLGGLFGDTFTPEKVDKGIGFLGALKPYLGSHKKEVCDIMIKALGAAKLLTIYKN